MRARFPALLALVLSVLLLALIIPVTGLPGSGPRPVPTRVQSLALTDIAPSGGRGMSGVENPTASRSAVVETEPFGLVGLSWQSPPPAGSTVKVRVREPAGWSSWIEVPFGIDHGPDPTSEESRQAVTGSDPLLTGESDALQVWVQTPDGQAPADAKVHLVDTDNVDVQQTPMSQAAAAPGMPPIITRAQWGADESMRNRGPIYSDVVKVGFVHHTVSSSTYTPEEAAAQVRNLYAWYTKGLKYSDMAYNFLVDRFGRLYEGRYGGMSKPVVGGHTAGLNTDSFAVSAMGNFEEYNPDSAKMSAIKDSIAKLMAWKLGLSKRDPGGKDTLTSNGSLGSGYWEAGEKATLNRVSGHKDAGNTACPGKFLYAQVADIRSSAARIYSQGGSAPPADVPDLVTPDPVTDEFSFRGSGSGDGVGVPVAGVLGQAREGRKAAAILKHYLTDVMVAPAADDKVISVDLGSSRQPRIDSRALGSGGGGFTVGVGKAAVTGGAKTVMRASIAAGKVAVQRKQGKSWRTVLESPKVLLRWAGTRSAGSLGDKPTALRVGADELRAGSVVLSANANAVRAVAKLRLRDEYLPYLDLASKSWPTTAMQAMAIAHRSRALAADWDSGCACHVSDQGFSGYAATQAKGYNAWRKAVSSTSRGAGSGLVVAYTDDVVDVPLFEASGGATLNGSDVRGQQMPWARSVADPWSLKSKNTAYASWSPQVRSQREVAKAFGLPDVAKLDLGSRLTGGAVAQAVATSASGKTATLSGEALRVKLRLPSAFVARSASAQPTTATSLSAALSAGPASSAVVVADSDPVTVSLAAAFAGVTKRALRVVAPSGPDAAARKALRPARTIVAVGAFAPSGLKALSKLGRVDRVAAEDAAGLSAALAGKSNISGRHTVFVAPASDAGAAASAAMGAVRAKGFLLVVGQAPTQTAIKWTKKHASRTIVVASRDQVPDRDAGQFRRPARIATVDPVARSVRVAGIGSRHGEAILVDSRRVIAAATAAASGQAVLFVQAKAGNAKAIRFLQVSPAISSLRTVGADRDVVAAARRA